MFVSPHKNAEKNHSGIRTANKYFANVVEFNLRTTVTEINNIHEKN